MLYKRQIKNCKNQKYKQWNSNEIIMMFRYVCDQLMEGEWLPPEGCGITSPPANNNVIGHVIHRLFDIARPTTVSLSGL